MGERLKVLAENRDAVVFRWGSRRRRTDQSHAHGVIQQDDGNNFGAMAAALDKAVVVLDSVLLGGGEIAIWRAIQLKGLATAVPEKGSVP